MQLEEIWEILESVSAPIESQQDMQDVVEPIVEPPTPRMSKKACHATKQFKLLTTGQRDILLLNNDEPKNYIEAMVKSLSYLPLWPKCLTIEFLRESLVMS